MGSEHRCRNQEVDGAVSAGGLYKREAGGNEEKRGRLEKVGCFNKLFSS